MLARCKLRLNYVLLNAASSTNNSHLVMAAHQDYVYVEEQSLWGKARILFLHILYLSWSD